MTAAPVPYPHQYKSASVVLVLISLEKGKHSLLGVSPHSVSHGSDGVVLSVWLGCGAPGSQVFSELDFNAPARVILPA